jgi:hypothetical protein
MPATYPWRQPYFCPGTFELFPEGIKGVTPLAVANENHRPCVHVQNHRQVPMPLENRNLIDGNPPNVFQTLSGKSPGQILLLNPLDHIPGDSQMSGNILNSHMFRQIQCIPFKSVAVRKPGIGKSELLLADIPATPTFKPLNLIIEKHPLQTNGNYPKSPGKLSPKDNVPAPANRTTNLFPFALDGKDDRPSCISGADIFVANQTKTVI